jgi:alkylated DNA nucleotide flippase Atl1
VEAAELGPTPTLLVSRSFAMMSARTYVGSVPDAALPTYQPHPVPATASDVARRIVAIANLVPPARWTTYGDLADAASSSGRGVASALSSVSPLAAVDTDIRTAVKGWVVPWHRIRMDDGRLKSRAADRLTRERQALANEMYVAEGGRLVANDAAVRGQRFHLAAELRRLRDRGERKP